MVKAVLLFATAGIVVGLAWPSTKPPPPPIAATTAASADDKEVILEREHGHFWVYAKVNGEVVHFLVDTGATGVALTAEDAERAGIPFSRSEFEDIGSGASGTVRGKLVTIKEIDVEGKKASNVPGAVLEGSQMSLLGQSYLSQLGEVRMVGDYMVLR
jgi:aspartyl protease family protein